MSNQIVQANGVRYRYWSPMRFFLLDMIYQAVANMTATVFRIRETKPSLNYTIKLTIITKKQPNHNVNTPFIATVTRHTVSNISSLSELLFLICSASQNYCS